jgi:hypothetical protein
MTKIVKWILTLTILFSSFSLHANRVDYGNYSVKQLKQQAATIHPAGLYILASKLFKENKKDDAVFWLTVGHLRFRFHLITKAESTAPDGSSLFSTLQNFIGTPIYDYAGINPETWITTAQKAKQWDLNNRNSFTPKEKYKKEYAAIHDEIDGMIKYITNNKDKIKNDRIKTKKIQTSKYETSK